MKKNQKILLLLPLLVLIYKVIANIRALTHFSLNIIMQVHLPLCLLGGAVVLTYHAQKGSKEARILCRLFALGFLAATIYPFIPHSFHFPQLTVIGIVNVFVLPILSVVCIFLSTRKPKTEKKVTTVRIKVPTLLLMLPVAAVTVVVLFAMGLQDNSTAWVILLVLLFFIWVVWDNARQKKLDRKVADVGTNYSRQNRGVLMIFQLKMATVSSAICAVSFGYGAYMILDFAGTGLFFWLFGLATLLFAGVFITNLLKFVDYLRYGYSKDFAITFYNACKEQGLLDPDDSVTVQRMVNLAQNHFKKIVVKPETSAVLLFEEGRKIVDGDKLAEQLSQTRGKCAVAKKEFITDKENVERFAEYTGREKRIAMLEREREIEAELAEKQYKQSLALRTASKGIKEKNPYIAGGIAQGLGGIGAGIAAAADTMNENAQIRAKNAATAKDRAAMASFSRSTTYGKASSGADARKMAYARYESALASAASCLVDDKHPASELFKCLRLGMSDITADPACGAAVFSLQVESVKLPSIPGWKEAVLDGTLIVTFIKNGQSVYELKFVLPVNGISKPCTLNGICVDNVLDQPFVMPEYDDISFAPYHLWMMERGVAAPGHSKSVAESLIENKDAVNSFMKLPM